ncbi:MAG TPA: SDR family NAD(P)-dependent oxidoreductase [Rhizomicrobium sp.]|jgi:NAD(P)-dependent dehydrogenase (short-subunit alcohol dehydrogenase family)
MTAIGVKQPVAVVTGAVGGIGCWIALGLARAGYHVVMVGRDQTRGEKTQRWIERQVMSASTELAIADLSLLSAAGEAGLLIACRHPKTSILINNAGIFEATRAETAEGFERVLATNFLSPFVLTRALLPALLAGGPSRIIAIGSSTSDHARIDPENLVLGRHWTMQRAYGQSKLALMMTTFALAKRLEGTGVVANVVHPGLVATGLVRNGGIIGLAWRCLAYFALTEEQGADTPLYAALAPSLATISGAYLKDRRAVPPNPQASDPVLIERVWKATEGLVDKFPGGEQI